MAFKIEEQSDFLFPSGVQKIDFFPFGLLYISKVNCLPDFSALLTVFYLNQRAKRGKKKSGGFSAVLYIMRIKLICLNEILPSNSFLVICNVVTCKLRA